MPIKLKKTNIQYDLETPEKGWVILGVDEYGDLVKKDETGAYEKIIKDDATSGIYLRLETDYLTIGNRVSGSDEGLYSLAQGNQVVANKIHSTSIGLYSSSTGDYSYSRGESLLADKNFSYVSGKGYSKEYPLKSSGINSFVHTYVNMTGKYGSFSDYSVVLGGTNNLIEENSTNSVIIGGTNNKIGKNTINSLILGGLNNIIPDYKTYITILSSVGINATKNFTVYTENIENGNDINTTNLRATNIYNNGTLITPSDERIKTKIEKLSNSEIKASIEISKEIGLYNFLYDIKNGINKKRVGLTVQKVIEIFTKNGLNPDNYSFINIHDTFDDKLDQYIKDKKIYGFNYNELTLFIIAGIEQRLTNLENK